MLLRPQLRAMQHSASWRITKPLRWMRSATDRVARRAARLLDRACRTVTFRLGARRFHDYCVSLANFKTIAASGLFDRNWYLDQNPDVRAAGINPLMHYLRHGATGGRDPNPLFDSDWYLDQNPDVRAAWVNPLVHYVRHGASEGRAPSPRFDGDWYLDRNPDVRAAGANPLAHYLRYGAAEGRKARSLFDGDWNRDGNSEVGTAGPNSIREFLKRYGQAEITASDLDRLPDVRALISRIPQLARRDSVLGSSVASVIIPVHGKLVYTLCCLEALLTLSSQSKFEIIVSDDASTDATADAIAGIGGIVTYRRNTNNLGFTRNCNEAAKIARGSVLVFLNNDTIPVPNWLDELVRTLDSDPTIGLVGSKLLNSNGTLQEAGGIVWRDGSAWNFGRGEDPDASQFNYVKDVDYVSGASIALPRAVWNRLGGFDEIFAPAYCEDTDLAFRVRALGLRTVYQPFSVVVHHEGISHGRDLSTGIKAYQVRNNRRFFERWQSTLAAENFPPGANVSQARDRSRSRPRILFIDHYIPQPDRDAGSRTIFDYLILFKSAGFSVVFWPQNMYFDRPYAAALQRHGIEVIYDLNSHTIFDDWLRERGPTLNYIFLSRPEVAIDYIDTIRRETTAKILFYGHDIHFQRLANEFEITGDHAIKKEVIASEKIERLVWSRCDVIYYPSRSECDFVRAAHPDKTVRLLPPFLYNAARIQQTREQLTKAGIPRSQQLLFVGGFRHRPNVDAMLWFVREVWPSIVSCAASCRLFIAGSFPPAEIQELAAFNIVVVGFVSDQELNALYMSTQVAIAPLRFGAGIKGKIIEALSHGAPVVTTSIGAQGLPDAQEFLDICDTPVEFAAAVIAILCNPDSHTTKVIAGLDFLEAAASEAVGHAVLANDVVEIERPANEIRAKTTVSNIALSTDG
jgi:GT2 family glycosyltransferase